MGLILLLGLDLTTLNSIRKEKKREEKGVEEEEMQYGPQLTVASRNHSSSQYLNLTGGVRNRKTKLRQESQISRNQFIQGNLILIMKLKLSSLL